MVVRPLAALLLLAFLASAPVQALSVEPGTVLGGAPGGDGDGNGGHDEQCLTSEGDLDSDHDGGDTLVSSGDGGDVGVSVTSTGEWSAKACARQSCPTITTMPPGVRPECACDLVWEVYYSLVPPDVVSWGERTAVSMSCLGPNGPYGVDT